MRKMLVSGYISGTRFTKDSAKLTFDIPRTQLDADLIGLIGQLFMDGVFGFLMFKEVEFDQSEKDLMETIDVGEEDFSKKTPSQRLYGTLYMYYKTLQKAADEGKRQPPPKEFYDFYKQMMEAFISNVKEKAKAI